MYRKNKELINYIIVGILTTIVSLVTYYGLVLTILDPQIPMQLQLANVLSWIAAVAFAYVTNRKYVFESKSKSIATEALRFYLSRVGTLLMDMAIMFVGVTLLSLNDKAVKIVVQGVVTVANYIFSKIFVFRK